VVVLVIKKYSAMFEPVAQTLQAVQLDLLQVQSHIHELHVILCAHRKQCDMEFSGLFKEIVDKADKVGVALMVPYDKHPLPG
jgi:hypothetical protein